MRDDGTPIAANDPFWDALQPVAKAARDRPAAWLGQDHIYGALRDDPRFSNAFEAWLSALWQYGTAETLATYVSGKEPA
jgi:mannitol 2-dehydrogenase